jgi:hypothetical protein
LMRNLCREVPPSDRFTARIWRTAHPSDTPNVQGRGAFLGRRHSEHELESELQTQKAFDGSHMPLTKFADRSTKNRSVGKLRKKSFSCHQAQNGQGKGRREERSGERKVRHMRKCAEPNKNPLDPKPHHTHAPLVAQQNTQACTHTQPQDTQMHTQPQDTHTCTHNRTQGISKNTQPLTTSAMVGLRPLTTGVGGAAAMAPASDCDGVAVSEDGAPDGVPATAAAPAAPGMEFL